MPPVQTNSDNGIFGKWQQLCAEGKIESANTRASAERASGRSGPVSKTSAVDFPSGHGSAPTVLMAKSSEPIVPPNLPGYTFLRHLGCGGMGDVWLVRDMLEREYALKVANRVSHSQSARTLGQISRLETLAKAFPPPLKMDVISSELGARVASDRSKLELIAQAVSDRHKVGLRLLRSASRLKNVVWARQVAMYAARQSGMTLVEIGRYFGNRDHTTVMHSCKKVADRIKSDPKLVAELRDFCAVD